MAEGIRAGAVFLCVLIAGMFLTFGIYTLWAYFRLKRGENVLADVTDYVREKPNRDKLLKIKYSVNGVEYEGTYSVDKPWVYMENHPAGTTVRIIVDPQKPKLFVLQEDFKKLLKPGIFYVIVSAAALAGFFAMLPQVIN